MATIFVSETKRRADNVDPADQFIRPAVGIHFVNDQRQHLESLRLGAAGKCKTAGDVVNEQAEWLFLFVDQIDQLLPELRVGHLAVADHHGVAHARYRLETELAAPVPVGMREIIQRRARHQKIFQDSVIHQHHVLRLHAFVVEGIKAEQYFRADV